MCVRVWQVDCMAVALQVEPNIPSAPHNARTRQILDESGIVLVPGSGFGQEEGTLHFRTTFLPAEETMHETLKVMAKAHGKFMDEHRD